MKIYRLKQKVEQLEAAATPTDLVLRTRSELFRSKGLRYLSTQGGFLLVLRCLISLCGARAITVALGIDCHRTTVAKLGVLIPRLFGPLAARLV